ncbi:hypothetical protein STRTUCAR8_07540, partial [Streptomyces turgidiscabies Car8]
MIDRGCVLRRRGLSRSSPRP